MTAKRGNKNKNKLKDAAEKKSKDELRPTEVEEKIESLENTLKESEDKLLRMRADFENFRKRNLREKIECQNAGRNEALIPVLNVFDHFDMAMDAAENADNMELVKEGMKMIHREFSKAISDLGVEKIEAVGDVFDPEIHEAVQNEHSDCVEEGRVIRQWKCGYRIGGRLLRPATVVVSTGPADENAKDQEQQI